MNTDAKRQFLQAGMLASCLTCSTRVTSVLGAVVLAGESQLGLLDAETISKSSCFDRREGFSWTTLGCVNDNISEYNTERGQQLH